MEDIDVNTGEVAVRRGEFILRAMAIGSCVVVAAYDPKAKVAGMAHIMLAGRAPKRSTEKIKYAADGIEELLIQMLGSGSDINSIEACLIGAGNVLKKEDDTICADNIKSVTAILAEKNIPVRARSVGGTVRRSASLDVKLGTVSCAEGDGSKKQLWML